VSEPKPEAFARVVRERDLFRQLLALGDVDDVRPFVSSALALLVTAIGAKQGYLELYGADGEAPLASVAFGLTEEQIAGVQARLSQGIIRDAISTGRTVNTASAIDDPRFANFESVQAQRISAVLCAPLALASAVAGADAGTIGVLYLEGRSAPGPFVEDDRQLVEIAARSITPIVEKLLERREEAVSVDHTLEARARLEAAGLRRGRQIGGKSRALGEVFRQISVAAPVPVTVLLRGESGTGKSMLARMLHEASPRQAGPFVEINVAALPETLFESELFGAEKGSHSQAVTRSIGKAEAAHGGTLFLDEIGELSLGAQAKLLSFLQNKRFMRLGGTTPITADARIVAATNANLEDAIREKRFREDLYYRINVLEIVVPPLRERKEDVAVIADAIASRLGDDESLRLPLSRAAARALSDAEWPGNVRQLENVVARGWATALSERAAAIEPRHLFGDKAPTSANAPASDLGFQEATRHFQGKLVADTLTACNWNVSEAARRLDLSRSHLNELIRGFSLARKKPG